MAMKLYSDVDIQDIADAIREVNGESTTYKVSEMADAIRALGVEPWEDTPSTIIAVRSYMYYNTSAQTISLEASNTEAVIMSTVANDYAFTDRNSNTDYLLPVDSKAKKATVTYTGSATLGTYRFQGFKDNGGTFTRVFDSTKIAENTYSFNGGAIDYIAISMELSGSNWSWSGTQDATVTFSN